MFSRFSLLVVIVCLAVIEAKAQTPVRISIGSAPPLEYRDPTGNPQGFSVDVIREAARRQGISLVWLPPATAAFNNKALREGALDLIVAGTATAERRASFYVSEPWWWSEMIAIAPAAGLVRKESDLWGRKLATPLSTQLSVAAVFKTSTVISGPNTTWAAEQACSGNADAALLENMFLRELLLAAAPSCRGVSLRTFDVATRRYYQLIGRPALAGILGALRGRIDEMTLDGTLAALAMKHLPVSTPQAALMGDMLRARQSKQEMRFGISAAALAALAGFGFLFWQQRSRSRLLAVNTQLLGSQQEGAAYLERLQAQLAERREAEERIVYQAQLIARTPEPIIAADNDHNVSFWNEAAARLLGWSEAEAIGKPLNQLAVPDHGAVPWQHVHESLARTGRFCGELIWLNRSGTRLTIDAAISRLCNAAGQPIGDVGGFRNITEGRQSQEALRKSEQRLRLITETIPVGIVVLDNDGHITFSNSTAALLLAVDKEELLDRRQDAPEWTFTDFDGKALVPEDRPFVRVMRTRKPVFGVDMAIRTADGKRTFLSCNAAPIFRADGEVDGVVESMQDVTAQYDLERQYRHAQKMESLGHMAGGVAHDFNNLLTVVSGYSELLLSEMESGSPQRLQVEQIRAAGARATELTRQLLAFSRKQLASPQSLNLNDLIRTDETMLRHITGEGIELTLRLDASLGTIFADRSQIQQVLMNLVINARDAMRGGGRLVIETSNAPVVPANTGIGTEKPTDLCVILAVEDTGAGIDAETLKHIFDPFFTTKAAGQGTGLGLSTVYGIVKQTGGWIRVESEPGKGARFSISLPGSRRPSAEKAAGSSSADADPVRSESSATRARETVLLVEDQPDVRRYLAACLRRGGYKVLEAASGKQALEVAREPGTHLDLLLTDMVMPGMSGRDLAETLEKERPGLRVLLISGYSAERIEALGLPRDQFGILQKPISPPAVVAAVAGILAGPKNTQAFAATSPGGP